MLILLIPIAIIVLATMFLRVGDRLNNGRHGTEFERWCSSSEFLWGMSRLLSIVALGLSLLLLVANHVDYASFPSEYESVKSTLHESRIEAASIERAAVVHKVIEMNRQLATVKYWNDSIWVEWFWPDRVAELEYIK